MSNQIPKQGEFCWNELMTGDVNKAKQFYKSLLGWKTEDMDMGEMTYTMLKQSDDKGIGGIMAIPKGMEKEIPPHWLSYIAVDDVDAMAKKAQQLGATIKVPVSDAGDYGRFAIIVDPTGAHIALWQSKKK